MKYLIIGFLFVFFMSCSSTKTVTKKDDKPTDNYDESFDPMTLDDNDIVFPNAVNKTDPKTTNQNQNTNSVQDFTKEVNGYRVQIIATQDLEKASLLEEEAKSQFSPFGHGTYLVFEAPLYKIRIGDFTTRQQADELKTQALDYGYREAFIVKTKVVLSPESNPITN